MVTSNPQNQYFVNKIMTATPQELTLMLYDGALKFCNKAIMSIEENKMQEAHNAIIRVQDIIQEFEITLNKDYKVSNDLELMYDYISRRLIDANIKKDISILEEVKGYIKELRDTWKEAMSLARGKKVVNQ